MVGGAQGTQAQSAKGSTPCVLELRVASERVIGGLLALLVCIEVAVVMLDLFVNYLDVTGYPQLRRMFNIAREDGIGTWVAVVQAFMIALVLWSAGLLAGARGDPLRERVGWSFLALCFVFLSLDDAAQIHERLGSVFRRFALGSTTETSVARKILDFYPSYSWQIVVGPVFALVGLFIVRFLWGRFRGGQRRYLLLWLVCWVLAIGLDFVEGLKGVHTWIVSALDARAANTVWHFSRSLEEFLEMLGATLLLIGLLRHVQSAVERVTISIESRPAPRSRPARAD